MKYKNFGIQSFASILEIIAWQFPYYIFFPYLYCLLTRRNFGLVIARVNIYMNDY